MDFSGKSVLVIEDAQGLRDQYSRDLRELGFTVVAVATAAKATEALEVRTFDLAWVDLALDGDEAEFEGHRLIRRVRELNEGTQILVVSAHDKSRDVVKAMKKKGADDFLSKDEIEAFGRLRRQIPLLMDLVAGSSIEDRSELSDALNAFFGTKHQQIETSKIISTISIDAKEMNSLIHALYERLKPIRLPKKTENIFTTNKDLKCVFATVWSKRFGSAVDIQIGGPAPEGEMIHRRPKPINQYVTISQSIRADFKE